MAQREIHSSDTRIDQKPPVDPSDYDGDIIVGERVRISKEYADELAFNEEPVTIRLEPSAQKNAPTHHPVWCNGTPAEIFENGRWRQLGWLPIGRVLTVRRKVVAILASSKTDTIDTVHESTDVPNPRNSVQRVTSAQQPFSILQDTNPRGVDWFTAILQRNQ